MMTHVYAIGNETPAHAETGLPNSMSGEFAGRGSKTGSRSL